jgi:assimilatory nitrate reductase catalytic subunit
MSVANALTDTRLDPVSRMPEFKACAVRLERHDGDQDADLTREPDRTTRGEAR